MRLSIRISPIGLTRIIKDFAFSDPEYVGLSLGLTEDQYADVKSGKAHIDLEENYDDKRVEYYLVYKDEDDE
jgi:site-specific DNA-adenine methylase